MARTMDANQLLADLAEHKMALRIDNGEYRHLLFRQPASGNMWFEIVTWPGSLTIHGDMGTWSFSRVKDMFTFFRSDRLQINASYWHEKITSESRFGGPSRNFDPDTFKKNVLSSLDGYGLSAPLRASIVASLEDEVFCEEDESSARRALYYFKRDGFKFSDAWEIDGEAYSFHYLWCLYAIVWGVQQYDAAKACLTESLPAGPDPQQATARPAAEDLAAQPVVPEGQDEPAV